MILANELRIGNFVKLMYGEKEFNIVSAIDEENIFVDDITWNYISINEVEPILLTEEWLLKLGFVKNDFDSHYEKGEFYIEVWEKDFVFRWNDFNIDINLNSVHRLQNLYFTLTNEELTLNKILC